MLDRWINSGDDDAIFEFEAAGDAPGGVPRTISSTVV
jgi:hypothetical protein